MARNETTFVKGRGAPLGNKNGRKSKDWERHLRAELHFYEDDKIKKGEALAKIARRVVEDALSDVFEVRHAARQEIANRLDGKPREHVDVDFTQRLAEELTDDELLNIIRNEGGGGDRAADEAVSEEDPSGLH